MRDLTMDKESAPSSFKISMRPVVLRVVLVFFILAFGMYVFSVSMNQVAVQMKPTKIAHVTRQAGIQCDTLGRGIPRRGTNDPHFPMPRTYNRRECVCTPVRFFVILSMQRSGSGWFETLLNSHPNISSNGEIFHVKQRKSSITSILTTLDTVYRLDWKSSAAKNDCVAAVGFKWMLNQAVMVYHRQLANYFNWKGVSVIFLFRRNQLQRLVSVLANAHDREHRSLNGTHKSHVHTKKEAEVLAKFKPTIDVTKLINDLTHAELTMAGALHHFNTTRHLTLYYEDLISNHTVLSDVQQFLGVPVRKLESGQVKIHTRPLLQQIENWENVSKTLEGTQYR